MPTALRTTIVTAAGLAASLLHGGCGNESRGTGSAAAETTGGAAGTDTEPTATTQADPDLTEGDSETTGEVPPPADPEEGPCSIWVATTGDNVAGDGSSDAPFASIDRAATAVGPGDTVCVREGVYMETGEFTDARWFSLSIGVFLGIDGTEDARITFRAAPGDEGKVVIDGGDEFLNIQIAGDYVTVKNFEIRACRHHCIATRRKELEGEDESQATLGLAVLHNYLHDSNDDDDGIGPDVSNISILDISTAKNPLVRNNWMHTSLINGERVRSHRAVLMCYACYGGTIENNDFSDSAGALLFKTQIPGVQGATVRNNNIHEVGGAINISTAGRAFTAQNYQVLGNSIATERTSIYLNMSEALGNGIEIRNNVFFPPTNRSHAIASRGYENIEISHNIFMDHELGILIGLRFGDNGPTYVSTLPQAKNNVFAGRMHIQVDQFYDGPVYNVTLYDTIGSWRNVDPQMHMTLNGSEYGEGSVNIAADDAVFVDAQNGDLTLTDDSPARNAIDSDGILPGPIQTGNEVIGLLPNTWVYDKLAAQGE